jgi:RNA polymerase sigma factor for flagellar operon FliA
MPPRTLAARPMQRQDSEASLEALWLEYRTSGSTEARDRLILHYSGLVTYVASRVGASMPSSVDYSDLIQAGVIGLIDSVARFEPERGLRFETYAVTRIRGAIIDELRSLDWVPRSVRKKARDLNAAVDDCQVRLGRTPSSVELAGALDVTPAELNTARAQVRRMRIGSLDELLNAGMGNDNLTLSETLVDPLAERPGDALDEQDLLDSLSAALAMLGERERAVLTHSYIDGLTLAQIGRVLGVTESRVSQIRTKALREVRAHLLALLAA